MTRLPPAPAHVAPYVEALGPARAVEFLLRYGGAEMYVAATPSERGRVAREMGWDTAEALSQVADRLPRRVPTAKRWVARCLSAQGLRVAEIARRLHVSDVTVRKYLASERDDPRQFPLI